MIKKYTSIVAISVVLSIAAAEAILHFSGLKGDIIVPLPTPLHGYYANDAVLGADIVRNYPMTEFTFWDGSHPAFSNALGCFDTDPPALSVGGYTLLVGDSFTWGYTRFEKKWGTVLETYVGEPVLKCGVSGTGTRYQLAKAREVIRETGVAPGLLLVGYTSNDLQDDVVFPDKVVSGGVRISRVRNIDLDTGKVDYFSDEFLGRKNLAESEGLKRFIRENSAVANIIWNFIKGGRINSAAGSLRNIYYVDVRELRNRQVAWAQRSWEAHLATLLEMKEFSKQIGAKLVVVLIPDRGGSNVRDTKEFLSAKGIAHIDLDREFRLLKNFPDHRTGGFTDLYWPHDAHWNETGNEVAGLLVARFLIENGLLPNYVPDSLLHIERVLDQIRKGF